MPRLGCFPVSARVLRRDVRLYASKKLGRTFEVPVFFSQPQAPPDLFRYREKGIEFQDVMNQWGSYVSSRVQ